MFRRAVNYLQGRKEFSREEVDLGSTLEILSTVDPRTLVNVKFVGGAVFSGVRESESALLCASEAARAIGDSYDSKVYNDFQGVHEVYAGKRFARHHVRLFGLSSSKALGLNTFLRFDTVNRKG